MKLQVLFGGRLTKWSGATAFLAKFGVRNIESFNEKQRLAKKAGKPLLDPSFNPETAKEGEEHPELEALPLIVIVIDEYR
jgi:S-DNA-T family DNA segregation ATPase FtsK/SpoIIIE